MYNIYNFKQTRTPDSQTETEKKKERRRELVLSNAAHPSYTSISSGIPWGSISCSTLRLAESFLPLIRTQCWQLVRVAVAVAVVVLWNLIASNRFIIPAHRIRWLYSLSCYFFLQLFVRSFARSPDFILFFHNAQLALAVYWYICRFHSTR